MENKLTWVELKKAVARQTNLTEKEVNLILTTWLNEMTAALLRGEEVRISGLGIFKLKTMKARKSVNVTTGEAIILPQTERLTYTMAAGLEDELNNAAPQKAVKGIDPIAKLSEQADEILDILGTMGQGPITEELKEKPKEEQKAEPVEPVVEPAKPAKKQRLWLSALITVLVFLLLLVGAFFFFRQQLERIVNSLSSQVERVETTVPAPVVEPAPVVQIEEPSYRVYDEFITTENMHEDSRLTWMAYRYYGKKDLWVFIYDANKENIPNPDRIDVGTPIRIPKLSQEIIDLATPELQQLVQDMYHEFLDK